MPGLLLGVVSRKLRADNLAFVSTAANVAALLQRVSGAGTEPGRRAPVGPALGGSYGVGLTLAAEQRTGFGGEAWLDIRDRLVVTAGLGVAPAEAWAAHGSLDLTFRQRFGHGALTAVFDLGPQLAWSGAAEPDGAWLDGALEPALGGRIGFNHVGLGVWVHPIRPRATLTLAFDWPGKLGVY